MNEVRLPPDAVLDFLEHYPHPALVLRASAIHAALVTRRAGGNDYKDSQAELASSSAEASDSPGGEVSRNDDGSSSPRLYAATESSSKEDRILASAFAAHPSATRSETPPLVESFLTGGDQQPHHPSRTAEGAVRAMHEQIAERDAKQERRRIEGAEERKEERKHNTERTSEPQWEGTGSAEENATGNSGRGLVGLFMPAWANSRWSELVRTRDSDLSLLALLDRNDFQKLLALLVDAVEPLSVGGLREGVSSKTSSEIPLATRVELRFPRGSIHYRAPGSAAVGEATLSEQLAARGPPDPNIYNVGGPSSSIGSGGSSSAVGRRDLRLAALDVVATLAKDSDCVILTTVLHLSDNPPPNLSPLSPPSPPSPPSPVTPAFPSHRPALTSLDQSFSTNSSTTLSAPSPSSVTPTVASPAPSPAPSIEVQEDESQLPEFASDSLQSLPYDYLPKPLSHHPGVQLLPSGLPELAPVDFPKAFVVERQRKRGRKKRVVTLETISGDEASANGDPVNSDLIIDPRDEGSSTDEEVSTSIPSLIPTAASNPFLDILSRTPMGRRIRTHPWHTSPLGPIDSWPPELRMMVSFMMASPFRTSIWYGEENLMLYNDAYAALAGSKHPALLGQSGADGFAEIWSTIGPLAAKVMQGETVSRSDAMLPLNRSGYIEETFHLWSFIPFWSSEGDRILGYLNISFETTGQVIAERRLAVIRDLVILTSLSRTLGDYCEKALHALSLNAYDLPFALLYTCEAPTVNQSKRTATGSDSGTRSRKTFDSHGASTTANLRFTLQGAIGVPDGHPSAPQTIALQVDTSGHSMLSSHDSDASSTTSNAETHSSARTVDPPGIWPFREACHTRKPVYIADLGNRAKGFEDRGWPEPPKTAVCIPITSSDTDSNSTLPVAMLVVGLNPRRPWDEVFATFLHLLTRQLAAGLAAVAVLEQDAKRAEELIALDKAKTNFFSNVSHELRTPLTLILGPLEDVLLAKGNINPDDRDRLEIVQRHANRLLTMVNTLLDFTRIEGAKGEILYRPVNLSAVTADLASLFRSAIERGGINFVVDCDQDPEDGRKIYLALDLWEKVVFNILGNAFKYTWKGTISISCKYEPTTAVVRISDTGCGIPPEELGSIFERFHRIEGTSRSRTGTGIGLALVLELVKALGGTLDVESELDVGSTFSVRLPRGSSHLPSGQVLRGEPVADPLPQRAHESLAIIEEAASWRLEGPLPDALTSASDSLSPSASNISSGDDHFLVGADLLDFKNSTILLVDDNTDLRGYVAGVLSRAYTVVQKPDGQAALDYALRHPPSLVISDVMMPGLDGNALLKALRSDPRTALIPVLFMSAQAGAEARTEALEQGCDDYLVKPFQSRELLARVNVHLQLGKMRKELEKRVEERTRALIESEMRYRGLADRYSTLSLLSPIGICLFSDAGVMTYANPRWFAISGHPSDLPLARWRECILPDDLPNVDAVWSAVFSAGSASTEPQRTELRWSHGNWTQFEFRSINKEGSQSGFVGSLTDISIMKEVERLRIENVEQRVAEERENRRNQEVYIDFASHELRNPLSGVYQNAEMVGHSLQKITEIIEDLQDGEVPDEATLQDLVVEMHENMDSIGNILVCASHQGRIADDLLLVSKLNMSLLSITPLPFNVEAKLREALKMVELECQQKQIALSLVVDDSVAAVEAEWVAADATRITQIVLNFLTNSVKYTSGIPNARVTVRVEAYRTEPPISPGATRVTQAPPAPDIPPSDLCWLTISVEDSGKGLSADEQARLFARFAQANPKSDQYGGSGLGLYVCKKLVELHGGSIEVRSAPGKGSTFKCAIPATRSAPVPNVPSPPLISLATPLSAGRSRRPGSSAGASSPAPAPVSSSELPSPKPAPVAVPDSPLHVLIAEDNRINQQILARQLKAAGFKTTIANHGLEALKALQADADLSPNPAPILVCLCDIEMPVCDGLTAVKELRRREAEGLISRRYPMIAVTGNARAAQVELCRSAGFDEVSIKPYKLKELLATIGKVTGRSIAPPA